MLISRSNLVVLGGTIEENNFSNQPNENEFKAILNRCKELVPSLEVFFQKVLQIIYMIYFNRVRKLWKRLLDFDQLEWVVFD